MNCLRNYAGYVWVSISLGNMDELHGQIMNVSTTQHEFRWKQCAIFSKHACITVLNIPCICFLIGLMQASYWLISNKIAQHSPSTHGQIHANDLSRNGGWICVSDSVS